MTTKCLFSVIVVLLLWTSCAKRGADEVALPAPVPVPLDTLALLTSGQWDWFATGRDDDSDLVMDGGSLMPYTAGGLKLYTFYKNGDLWDSSFMAGTLVNMVQLSWEFGDSKSKLAFYLGPKIYNNVNVYMMTNFSDTTLVLRPIFAVGASWRLFKKHVRK